MFELFEMIEIWASSPKAIGHLMIAGGFALLVSTAVVLVSRMNGDD